MAQSPEVSDLVTVQSIEQLIREPTAVGAVLPVRIS